MTAIGFNHVAIYGDDIEELIEFYTAVFGLTEVPSPNLGVPVAWLECGDKQLHLVERETEPPQYHHFALTVSDFETVYETAQAEGYFDEVLTESDELPLFGLPDGAVQLYLRDPADNLVEATWPDRTTLPAEIDRHVIDMTEEYPQTDAESRATLFLDDA